MTAVVDPLTGCLDPLARGDHRRPPHHGGQVAPSPHLDTQHAEAGLGIVEGYPLNRTDQHLANSRACEGVPGGGQDVKAPASAKHFVLTVIRHGRHASDDPGSALKAPSPSYFSNRS